MNYHFNFYITNPSVSGLELSSQASPKEFKSESAWSVLLVNGQLSQASPTESESLSSCCGLNVYMQLSWKSNNPGKITFPFIYIICHYMINLNAFIYQKRLIQIFIISSISMSFIRVFIVCLTIKIRISAVTFTIRCSLVCSASNLQQLS